MPYQFYKRFFYSLLVLIITNSSNFASAHDKRDETAPLKNRIISTYKLLWVFGSSETLEHDFIRYLGHFYYAEVAQHLLMRIDFELEYDHQKTQLSNEQLKEKFKIIHDCLISFYPMGTTQHRTPLEMLRKKAQDRLLKNLPPDIQKIESELLMTNFENTLDEIKTRENPLVSLEDFGDMELEPGLAQKLRESLPKRKNLRAIRLVKERAVNYTFEKLVLGIETLTYWDPQQAIKDIELRFYPKLEDKIVAQKHVLKKVKSVELQSRLHAGKSEKSELLYFMGPVSTGKKPIAQAWVDALYDQEGAYKKHMYVVPAMRSNYDLFSVLGSTTGLVGSNGGFSPFIKWLVEHSGGRYKIVVDETDSGLSYSIVENPEWEKGKILEGHYPPEAAFLYLSSFQSWSKISKDLFLKGALESGYFRINNPGKNEKSVDKLYVPVRIIIESSEGISLVDARETTGERFGSPLSYESRFSKWKTTYTDPLLLKEQLTKTNSAPSTSPEYQTGTSEDLLALIPNSSLVLFEPLSPDHIKQITAKILEQVKARLKESSAKLNLSWAQSVTDFVQEFQYISDENASPLEDKIKSMIEGTIYEAILAKVIPQSEKELKIHLSVARNPDRTSNLVLTGDVSAKLPIDATQYLRHEQPISDAELEKWFGLAQRLEERVVGASVVAKELAKRILITQSGRNRTIHESEATQAARTFMFLGLSSTGKTEMAKAIAKEAFQSEDSFAIFNFNNIKTEHEMQKEITGSLDSANNVIASRLMKEIERHQGKLVVVMDEFSNAPKELLKNLYDLFREPVVRTFAGGRKAYVMSNVIFIITGNAGEEWYQNIPKHIPEGERQAALEETYQEALKNPDVRRYTLEKYFSSALINRVGEPNIFFFSPLTYKSIRELSQLKIKPALKALAPKPDQRGWDIKFLDNQAYTKFLEIVEQEGYVIDEQGASIDRFINTVFKESVHEQLLRNKIPHGAKVALYFQDQTEKNTRTGDPGYIILGAHIEGRSEPLTINVKRRHHEREQEYSATTQIETAYHEAGHEIVRYAYFHDVYETDFLTIIPGVGDINGRMIRYLGLVKYDSKTNIEFYRKTVLQMMAIKFGGFMAQQLITKGGIDDAGKNNDMQEATYLAQRAVLEWGLSKKFGYTSKPPELTLKDYIQTLTEDRRKLLDQEVEVMMKEAQELARQALLLNFETGLVPLATHLAKVGTIYGDTLKRFYTKNHDKIYRAGESKFSAALRNLSVTSLVARASKWFSSGDTKLPELLPFVKLPTSIKTYQIHLKQKRAAQLAKVSEDPNAPIFKDLSPFKAGCLDPLNTLDKAL